MTIRRAVILAGVPLVLIALLWRATPYYMYFAHTDGSGLPAKPWLEIPSDAPSTLRVYNKAYEETAERLVVPMEQHRQQIGAAAISAAVLVGREVVWAASSGWGDVESGYAATPDTRFRIGSTSKALTATGLARLVESGQLGFDTRLDVLWKTLPNPGWKDITPRHLGSHMSGLPHYGENRDLAGLMRSMSLQHHYDSVHEALGVFDGSELLFRPGTDFHYSSYGTVLLSAAMSKASGMSYLDTLDQLVFTPNGMHGVVVSPKRPEDLPDMATPYHHNGEAGSGRRLRRWYDIDLSHRLAGGGFAATPSDLVKLARSYFHRANPDALDPHIVNAMWTPQQLESGVVNEQNYGIGWRVRQEEFTPGRTYLQLNHGGVSRGGQSWLMLIPEAEIAIAININGRTDVFRDFAQFSFEMATATLQRQAELDDTAKNDKLAPH